MVFCSEPPISISLLSLKIIKPPHPPGPGLQLQAPAVAASTATTSVDFADVTWSSATFGAAFAAIYNDDQGDKLCVVLDFGGTKTATNGDFTISFPDPSTPSNAIISLTS